MSTPTNPDLEQDLLAAAWLVDKVKQRNDYAQNVYAALCNNEFQRQEIWPVLSDQRWSCTWRYAGSIVANLRGEGEYMDWYCSGSRAWNLDDDLADGYVSESIITEEVREDLVRLGWLVCESEKTL